VLNHFKRSVQKQIIQTPKKRKFQKIKVKDGEVWYMENFIEQINLKNCLLIF